MSIQDDEPEKELGIENLPITPETEIPEEETPEEEISPELTPTE